MIRYDLICSNNHKFESWFKDSKSFKEQANSNDILCPTCNDTHINKTLMSPSIPKKGNIKKVFISLVYFCKLTPRTDFFQ